MGNGNGKWEILSVQGMYETRGDKLPGVMAMRFDFVGGCPRIARGEPWAGSVTGGEACGYPCSEKEGFTHPWLWRAPCFWGTYE
jgi:hypothetical protein